MVRIEGSWVVRPVLACMLKSASSAQDIAAEVLQDADGALHALVSSVWPHIADESPEKLQMLIDMLRRICTSKVRSQPIRALPLPCAAYITFMQLKPCTVLLAYLAA